MTSEEQLLRAAVKSSDLVIQKQEAKIQALQAALVTDQVTIRRLEAILAQSKKREADTAQQEEIEQTAAHALEERIAETAASVESANRDLSEQLALLTQSQHRHALLSAKLKIAQEELEAVNGRERDLLARISELTNQKRTLEAANAEMQQQRARSDELQSQLDVFRVQIEQLEVIRARNQEAIRTRDSQLAALKEERRVLQERVRDAEGENDRLIQKVEKLERGVSEATVSQREVLAVKEQLAQRERELAAACAKLREMKAKQRKPNREGELRARLKALEEQLENERRKGVSVVAELEQHREVNPKLAEENEYLRAKLAKLHERCGQLKHSRADSMEQMYDLKMTAARLEGELENAEKLIVALKNERDEVRAKLVSAEGFLDQCCSRMNRVERESDVIRKHMHAVNENQGQMAAVQLENDRLRNRLDHLETDLEAYTERQRRTLIRPRRFRV